jgi:hypothetical protein
MHWIDMAAIWYFVQQKSVDKFSGAKQKKSSWNLIHSFYKFRFWKDSCTCLLYMRLLLYADKEYIFQQHQEHDILLHMDIPKNILILCPHVISLHSEILM